jgi:hypothetical protein
MDNQQVVSRFREFQTRYPEEEKDAIWKKLSSQFREFWSDRILNQASAEPGEAEIDQVVRILDVHAKGNTSRDEAVARVMTTQAVWRRLFREVRREKSLHELLNRIFSDPPPAQAISLLDDLYRQNEGRKNNLTGKSASVINALLFAYSPSENLSVVSLNDRKRIVDGFAIPGGPDFEQDSPGKKIVYSNKAILDWFRANGIVSSPRTVSCFLYDPLMKTVWKSDTGAEGAGVPIEQAAAGAPATEDESKRLFYMESQLEDFLIENWDKTELGKKLDLLEENGDIISQQYQTEIGKIDILAQDKQTKQYVVIELKKGQTSDDTVGQLTRYMGWLEEHKTNNAPTRGIIIAGEYDSRLHYALKKIKDVEVYLYRVDFRLEEFKQG